MVSFLERKQNPECSTTTLHTLAIASSIEAIEHIEVGCFFELDQSKLPPEAPELLNSTRIVMVSKKELSKVSVRFPSLHSLKTFLNENVSVNNQLPAMDDKYYFEPETASGISEQSKVWSFWLGAEQGVIKRRRFDSLVRSPVKKKNRMVKASVRYKLGEENMLKVLKARGANAGKPIKMTGLRNEARKLIGGTGLLKHMAGKVSSGGADGFRRRHNADGAMEYSLESTADLVEIRKESGVQDPICATMLKELWDEIYNLKKREMESKQPEQALAMVTTTSNPLRTCTDWDQAYSSGIRQKMDVDYRLQEEIMELKSTLEESAAPLMYYSERADVPQMTDNERGVIEAKATNLRRLRSGFWIHRPHETFLSAVPTTPHSVFVTSSARPAMPLDLVLTQSPYASSPGSSSGCLVTPFSERHPVKTSSLLCNAANRPSLSPSFTRVASAIEKITTLYQSAKIHRINLNGIPGDAKDNEYTAISRKHTYQRRHQLELKSTTEASGAELMYYSEAAVPQLKDNARGVKDDKPTKLETLVLRSACRICRPPGTFLWPSMNMSMSQHQANLVLPRSLRGLNHGSSSGSLVKPFAERRPVNRSTLLCNVTYPPSRSPAFSRVPSEAKDANTRFSPTNLGDALAKRCDDMRNVKGTTAVARIGHYYIDLASDQRQVSPGGFVLNDRWLKLLFIDLQYFDIVSVGVGVSDICTEFIAAAIMVNEAVFRGAAHALRVYLAARLLMACIDHWEDTHARNICKEGFLLSGYSDGQPLVFIVKSRALGGISYGGAVGYTVAIGGGIVEARQFIQTHVVQEPELAVVPASVVVASLVNRSTGGHVHSIRLPLHGNGVAIDGQPPSSVLQLLERHWGYYQPYLWDSLFFVCLDLDYTEQNEARLSDFLGREFPGSWTHIISCQTEIIRLITFFDYVDRMAAWVEVRNGYDWHDGGQLFRLTFYEPTAGIVTGLRNIEQI